MTIFRCALLIYSLTALCACASPPRPATGLPEPESLLDTVFVDSTTGNARTLPELVRALADSDVIVVGEYHGHNGAHLMQARLQQALHQQDPALALSMEQFEQQHQPALDAYLANEIGESALQEDADAWANYEASYRPLVEYARQHGLSVIAANAPAGLVRCVARQGPAWLDTLDAKTRKQIPPEPFFGSDSYRTRFYRAMGAAPDEVANDSAVARRYHAQLLRDNTMAGQIASAHRQHPERQILHLTGTFHSQQGLGTVESLRHRAPDLTVTVLTPIILRDGQSAEEAVADNREAGDFLYLLRPLPPRFRDSDRRQQAFSHPDQGEDCRQPG